MGWTSYYANHYKNGKVDRKAECDAYFMEGLNRGHFKVLKSAMKGAVYYAAIKDMVKIDENGNCVPTDDGRVWAAIFLTSVDGSCFYYKPMDETCGPYYYDCPKLILKLLNETDNEYALNWRQKCIEEAERKQKFSKLPIGTVISFTYPDGRKMKAYKHEPAYQFKRPFWMSLDGYHVPNNSINDWEVVEK